MNTLSHLFPEQIERLKERFWKKVEIRGEDDCWEWTAALNTSGYGHIQVSTKRLSVAHRVCYMLRFGDIPPKMLVCHSCDNPKCVNPKHLWIGTHNQNMEDMASKIRSSNPSSRKVWTNPEIINQTVLEIVDKYKKGMSQAELALEFSLSKNTISRIVLGRSRGAITGQKKVLPKKNLRGINNSKAKLTEAEVLEIYSLAKNRELTQEQIAAKFNISRTQVQSIFHGRCWAYLTGTPHISRKS